MAEPVGVPIPPTTEAPVADHNGCDEGSLTVALTAMANGMADSSSARQSMSRKTDAHALAYELFRQKFAKHPKMELASEQITWIKTYRK